ncbi:SRPBCC family protein [Methyloversatilis thermotolerans]|uniref:SRPBCC family protein n=1 Tax=Methyloversatilis thermotolerans TaxID=1346290 RepID=UPI0003784FA7|nr:SRPBCC family protein [Methyloversatilis thermotolerans]
MRFVSAFIMMLATCVAASVAHAHGPTRQKAFESITIKASPDAVWAKVSDFANLQGWHPAVESSTATDGSKVGSVRTLKIKGGGEIVETLETIDPSAKKFSYRAKDGGALPVTNYSSNITVKAGDGGTAVVEWRGAFYRKYMNNDPPKGEDDEAAMTAVTGVYKSGLENLKKIMEK